MYRCSSRFINGGVTPPRSLSTPDANQASLRKNSTYLSHQSRKYASTAVAQILISKLGSSVRISEAVYKYVSASMELQSILRSTSELYCISELNEGHSQRIEAYLIPIHSSKPLNSSDASTPTVSIAAIALSAAFTFFRIFSKSYSIPQVSPTPRQDNSLLRNFPRLNHFLFQLGFRGTVNETSKIFRHLKLR